MKKYKKPKIKEKKIKIQFFLKKKSLSGIEEGLFLACAPSEACCGVSC
jgi:hypothetical protein